MVSHPQFVGVSLSEPHTSLAGLHCKMYLYVGSFAAIYCDFKLMHLIFLKLECTILAYSVCEGYSQSAASVT